MAGTVNSAVTASAVNVVKLVLVLLVLAMMLVQEPVQMVPSYIKSAARGVEMKRVIQYISSVARGVLSNWSCLQC